MGRIFSGATKAEVEATAATREFFIPLYSASNYIIESSYFAGRVANAGEYANIMLRIPHDFNSLTSLEIIYIAKATVANMHASFNIDIGDIDGNYGFIYSGITANRSLGATTLNYLYAHDITDIAAIAALVAANHVSVQVQYSATAQVSNLIVLGVRLRYA